MAELRRRTHRPGMQFGQMPAMQQRRPGRGQAMPSQGRAAGRGAFPRARGRRSATTPAWLARGRRGVAAMPAESAASRAGFTRDRNDTGGMRMKPGWALTGWSRIPIIGGLIEALLNVVFKYRRFEQAEKQRVGFFGRKGRLVPVEGPEMTPQDMEALTLGTGRFAQRGARQQGAAQRGARQRGMMQGAKGQRAFARQRATRQRPIKQAA